MALVYSCCFSFSLRLGAVLIGLFSLMQAGVTLVLSCLAQTHQQVLKDTVSDLIENMELLYTKAYFEDLLQDPEKYIKWTMCLTCIYIVLCVVFIYGALTCSTVLLLGYILGELARLATLSFSVVTWLLVLKRNTMDIGLLIGASVAFGFVLLGMFYLWVCAANLPILINEMERDEQAATIARLQRAAAAAAARPGYVRHTDDDYYDPMPAPPFTIAKFRSLNNY